MRLNLVQQADCGVTRSKKQCTGAQIAPVELIHHRWLGVPLNYLLGLVAQRFDPFQRIASSGSLRAGALNNPLAQKFTGTRGHGFEWR
jgi:hypothetical protein